MIGKIGIGCENKVNPATPVAYSLFLIDGSERRFIVHTGTIEQWIDRDGRGHTFKALTLIQPDRESAYERGRYHFSKELNDKLMEFYELQKIDRVGIVIDHQNGSSSRYWAQDIQIDWQPDKPWGKFSFAANLDPTPDPFIYE